MISRGFYLLHRYNGNAIHCHVPPSSSSSCWELFPPWRLANEAFDFEQELVFPICQQPNREKGGQIRPSWPPSLQPETPIILALAVLVPCKAPSVRKNKNLSLYMFFKERIKKRIIWRLVATKDDKHWYEDKVFLKKDKGLSHDTHHFCCLENIGVLPRKRTDLSSYLSLAIVLAQGCHCSVLRTGSLGQNYPESQMRSLT